MRSFCMQTGKSGKFFPLFAKQNPANGFSLIEIMAVIAILALVMVLGLSSFGDYAKRQQYLTEASDVSRMIQEQRAKAVSSLSDSEYGINVSSTTITLYKGNNYDPDDANNEVVTFVTMEATSTLSYQGLATTSLSFAKRTGEPSATGTIKLYPVKTEASTTTINIHGSGLVE